MLSTAPAYFSMLSLILFHGPSFLIFSKIKSISLRTLCIPVGSTFCIALNNLTNPLVAPSKFVLELSPILSATILPTNVLNESVMILSTTPRFIAPRVSFCFSSSVDPIAVINSAIGVKIAPIPETDSTAALILFLPAILIPAIV